MGTTIKLKNSVVQDRIPSAVDIEIGELCVGAHADSPALFFKDHTDNIIKIEPSPGPPANIGNTPPSGAAAGDLWWSTNNGENTLYVYYDDGVTSQWVISVPTSEGGSNFLPLTGGALTGPLTSTSTASFADGDMTVSVDGDIFLGALDFTSAAGQGSQYYYYGVVKLQRPSTAPANAELIDCYWGTQQAFRVEVDGNMLTAGSITAASTIKNGVTGTGVQLFNDGTIQSWNNGNLNFNVTSGGSITAAGLLTVNNNARIYRPTSKGGNVAGNALLTLDSDVNGVGTSAVSITTDGKITAAGTIFSGAIVDHGATSREGSLMGAGSVFIQKTTGNNSSALVVYQGANSTPKFSVKGDGSVIAAGTLLVGGDPGSAQNGVKMHPNGYIACCGGHGSGFVFAGSPSNTSTSTTLIFANGNATFSGTVTATVVPPSDAKFKENIEPAKPQLDDVVALGGLLKNYDWNEDAPVNDELRSQRQLGLIAQEAAEVCPNLVKDIHRTKTVEVTPAVKGPKGKVIKEAITKEEDDSYKGISTDALIMKLIGAVTELTARVAELEKT